MRRPAGGDLQGPHRTGPRAAGVDHRELRAKMRGDAFFFLAAPAAVERHENRAEAGGGEQEGDVFRRVAQRYADSIADADAALGERDRRTVDERVERGIADLT